MINTERKPIIKINQMSIQQFLSFLREFIQLFDKNNQLDLTKVIISEKIDGQAIRFVFLNNDLYFENSSSGVVTWDNMPFPNDYKLLYDCLLSKFQQVFKGMNIKLIGELIWINDLAENQKITPVCASYLTKYFGKLGGMVVFDIKQITNDNQLIDLPLSTQTEVFNKLSFINDSNFMFYNINDIILKNVQFKLNNLQQLKYKLSLPQYNKNRYSVINDSDILQDIKQIQTDISIQFENIINNITGRFSAHGDLIEGIVITIKSSGNQYGIFSENYKILKKENCKYTDQREQLIKQFFKDVFNVNTLSMIRKKLDLKTNIQYTYLYDLYYPDFIKNLSEIYNNLKNDITIPKGTKHPQMLIFEKYIKQYNQLNTYNNFINNV